MSMTVMVTGAAGYLGRQLLRALLPLPSVARVIAVDLAPLPAIDGTQQRKYQPLQADVRDARVLAQARSCQLIIHCAWVVVAKPRAWRHLSPRQCSDAQRQACATLVQAQSHQAAARFVFLSSAIVYGLDHQQKVTEQSPLLGVEGCDYAHDKVQTEQWLQYYRLAGGESDIVILRPGIVLDHDCQPLLRRLLLSPFGVRHGHWFQQPVPWVWSGDVVEAILKILATPRHHSLSGAYNLAAQAHLSPAQAQAYLGRGHRPIPAPLARTALALMWRLHGGQGQAPWEALASRGLRLDCSAARRHLGWRPQRDTWRTLDSLLEDSHGGYSALQKTARIG